MCRAACKLRRRGKEVLKLICQEETPYISWISARAVSAGDQLAFGAADSGALEVSSLDRNLAKGLIRALGFRV